MRVELSKWLLHLALGFLKPSDPSVGRRGLVEDASQVRPGLWSRIRMTHLPHHPRLPLQAKRLYKNAALELGRAFPRACFVLIAVLT